MIIIIELNLTVQRNGLKTENCKNISKFVSSFASESVSQHNNGLIILATTAVSFFFFSLIKK